MTDVESTDWSATDASNTQAVPNGAPNNFARTETKNIFRMVMGGVKRLRNRMTPTVTSSGTAPAFTLTYTGAPAYVQGSTFAFKTHDTTTGSMTLNVNTVGAKKVYDITGTTQLAAGAFAAGTRMVVAYDTALDSAAGGFVWLNGPLTYNRLPRSFLSGCGTSRNSGTPNTKIDVAVGAARDSTDVVDIIVASTLTIDYGTTGANGLDTGSLANTTWYHHFVIMKADGTVAGFGSTSLTPTLPSGYLYKRRVGAIKTDGSAHFLAYSQLGDEFLWSASVLDISANNPGTSAVSRTLSVPTSIQVWALFNFSYVNTSNSVAAVIGFSELDRADEAPSNTAAPLTAAGVVGNSTGQNTTGAGVHRPLRTNTSAQIRSRASASDANCTLYIATVGWIDRRGRDD